MTSVETRARTLTFLFTDIEGSTRLWEAHPVSMRAALTRHDAILHEAISGSDGQVVKTTGDGVMAVFEASGPCLAACVAAQLELAQEVWGETGPLRVRMGVHTGEVADTKVDFHGPTVNRAARIMAAGHGGQVLLSAATVAMVDDLPDAWSLRDLGEHRLKDIGRAERIYQLVHPELPDAFPSLATADTRVRPLPADGSAFVGRQAELGELVRLLESEAVRLMTLTGPGGIGKTRLALHAAREVQADFDPTVFVDLSAARDTDAVLLAVAREVGLTDRGEQAQLDELAAHIGKRRYLLLLDNFEQVTEAAPAVAQLLTACPNLKVIVTSRAPLRIRGEHLYAVPPLGLPEDVAHVPAPDGLLHFEAIALFVERARAVRPDFRLTDDNAAAVVEICRRLDGLPLAIELATARLGLFSPEALRDRLDSRLRLLKSGARDLPERQQTLRATIEWSHHLLEPAEQAMFSLLAVFAGAELADIEAVAVQMGGRIDALDAVDALASLAEKSLVRQVDRPADAPRFVMLETIREFALERLAEDPAFDESARLAHAIRFAGVAERLSQLLAEGGREAVSALVTTERQNLEAAWRCWVDLRSLDRLELLLDAVWPLYDAMGWYRSALQAVTDVLDISAGAPHTPERSAKEIRLRTSLARTLLVTEGYSPDVEQAYTRASELFGADVEAGQQLPVLRGLAHFHTYRGEFAAAADFGRRVLALPGAATDPAVEVTGRLIVGSNILMQGDVSGGLRELDLAIQAFETRGYTAGRFRLGADPRVASLMISALGYWLRGDGDGSLARASRALELATSTDHPLSIAYARFHSGLLHLWRSEPEVVRSRALGVLEAADAADLHVFEAIGTCMLGTANVALGQVEHGFGQLRDGIALYRGLTTPPVFWPNLLLMDAWACYRAGRFGEGLLRVDEAAAAVGAEAASPVAPDLFILRGDLLAGADAADREAHATWAQAFQMASDLGLQTPRLRAATRLARAGAAAGEAGDWRAVLREVYETFGGGFDTADLVAARDLLTGPRPT